MATKKPTTYVADDQGRYVIPKDPDARLTYSFNWTDWLLNAGNDVISSVLFIPQLPLITTDSQHDAHTASCKAEGGIEGQLLCLTCRITTTGGQTEDRSVYLKITER